MAKFVTKAMEAIKGRKTYEQLVVLPDTVKNPYDIDLSNTEGIWDEYERTLESRYKGSLSGLISIMNRDAEMQSLNEFQFKDVTPKGESVKEYEIKYQDLRAYAIKITNGKLVVLGGYKNQQKRDFKTFRSLKKQYLESL